MQRYSGNVGLLVDCNRHTFRAMEKEHSEGIGSLLLLFLAILTLTCCIELGSTKDKTAASSAVQGELVDVPNLPARAATVSVKIAVKQLLLF